MTTDTPDRLPAPTRRRNFALPLLLIALGAVLLLNNLGLLPWGIWATLWKLWPLALILVGLEMLLLRRVAWGGTLLTLVIVAAIVTALVFFTSPGRSPWAGAPIPAIGDQQALGEATRGYVDVQFAAGNVAIRPMDGTDVLARWSRWRDDSADAVRMQRSYQVQNGTGRLDLRVAGSARSFVPFLTEGQSGAHLDLELNRNVPLDLEVQLGAAEADLDLADLKVSRLRLDAGASRSRVRMPAAGQTTAMIRGGATDLRLEVPPGVAARLVIEGALSSIQIDAERFPMVSSELGRSEYRSPDYETAVDRLDATISLGAAGLRVD